MDKKNKKKFIQSPVAIICYVLAALMLVYACYQAGSTVNQINEYYASYGMSAKPAEYVTYVLQAILEPLIHAFTFFIAGYILNTVRKLDPGNYKTAEELVEIEEAKKEAKEKKQAAKGEARAAKSEAKGAKAGFSASSATEEESVRADFAESLEAELKSDAKASSGGNRKSGQSRSRNSSAKNGSKNGTSKSGSKSTKSTDSGSGSKKSSGRKSAPKKDEVKEAQAEAQTKAEEAVEAKTGEE